MRNLHGIAVVVAGASSGIGRATALAVAREGARLALAARREELLEKVAEDCRGLGFPGADGRRGGRRPCSLPQPEPRAPAPALTVLTASDRTDRDCL